MRKFFSLLFVGLLLSFAFGFSANGTASARDCLACRQLLVVMTLSVQSMLCAPRTGWQPIM